MLSISQSTLNQLQQLKVDQNPSNVAAGYQLILNDLLGQGLNISNLPIADQAALNWLQVAVQVNTGQKTFEAVYIRANNAAAVLDQTGKTIDLFGPEETNSTNAIGQQFIRDVMRGGGTLPPTQRIYQTDPGQGLSVLGVSPSGWTGAYPDAFGLSAYATGLYANDAFSKLTPQQQAEAISYHAEALDTTIAYFVANGTLPSYLANYVVQDVAAIDNRLIVPVYKTGTGLVQGAAQLGTDFYQGLVNAIGKVVTDLSSSNGLPSATVLTGDVNALSAAAAGIYVIKSGDTFASIAANSGIAGLDATTLAAINETSSGAGLAVGSAMIIPTKVISTASGVSLSITDPAYSYIVDSGTGLAFLVPVAGISVPNGLTVINGSGTVVGEFAGQSFSATSSAGGITVGLSTGASSIQFGANGAITYDINGQPTSTQFAAGSLVTTNGTDVSVTPNGSFLTTNYTIDPTSGSLLSNAVTFSGNVPGTETAVNVTIGLDTPSTSITDQNLTISVVNLSSQASSTNLTTDPTGQAVGGLVISAPDVIVVDPSINTSGVFNNSPGSIITGDYQPGNQQLLPTGSDLGALISGATQSPPVVASPTYDAPLGDYNTDSNSFADVDPLVLDLSGNGIQLSNWIDNGVYFATNVNAAGKADGLLHHTSWVNASDGILAFDVNGNGRIDDITETLSEFFQGKSFSSGFAALASLAQAGATSFSAATSLTDPKTGKSYFSELMVWQDTNQNGVSDPGELHSLSSLGITSISLQGSANVGEEINGSAVTSRATYTTATGTGQIASVELQTDTTGDVTSTADGGVVITSTPEGGASSSNTFVAKAASAHTYVLSGGTLTDQTTGTVLNTGTIPIKGVFSTTQGDIITVASTDTGSYWLGGGSGADVLTGGAGNTVFFVNASTVVHGGSGFNIAEVVGSQPVNIDLMKSNLQEVIGGSGGGVFNGSGTSWNIFVQGGSGNNIIIGGAANDALAGGTGDDLIEAGSGGSVIHAGAGNDVIYGGSGVRHRTGRIARLANNTLIWQSKSGVRCTSFQNFRVCPK